MLHTYKFQHCFNFLCLFFDIFLPSREKKLKTVWHVHLIFNTHEGETPLNNINCVVQCVKLQSGKIINCNLKTKQFVVFRNENSNFKE